MAKNMTNDMTVGSPAKVIMSFMIPLCLGNIFQQFYNLADSVIAGKYIGVDALAAIGSTGSLIFLVIGWLSGIASGFAVLISQCFGAGDYKKMRHYLAMSVYLCIGLTVTMTAGLLVLNYPILRMTNAPDNIIGDIADYMRIIYAGLIVTVAYNALSAILRALGDSKSPLYFLMISAALNVGLDIVLIIYFHMGVEGCAYATVIAQGISALLCFFYMRKKFDILKLQREDWRFSADSMRRMLGLGIPMGLQFSITAIGAIIVQSAINVYGAVYIAGYSAAGKIQNIVTAVFVAFGGAIATYTGQNYGAGKLDRVKEGVKVSEIMTLIWSVLMIIFVKLFGRDLMTLFVDGSQTDVIEVAVLYFDTVILAYPMLGSIFIYRNVLQGLGYGFMPMMGGLFELLARAGVVMMIAGEVGFRGVCMADPFAWIAALIPLIPYYIVKMKKLSGESRAVE